MILHLTILKVLVSDYFKIYCVVMNTVDTNRLGFEFDMNEPLIRQDINGTTI